MHILPQQFGSGAFKIQLKINIHIMILFQTKLNHKKVKYLLPFTFKSFFHQVRQSYGEFKNQNHYWKILAKHALQRSSKNVLYHDVLN